MRPISLTSTINDRPFGRAGMDAAAWLTTMSTVRASAGNPPVAVRGQLECPGRTHHRSPGLPTPPEAHSLHGAGVDRTAVVEHVGATVRRRMQRSRAGHHERHGDRRIPHGEPLGRASPRRSLVPPSEACHAPGSSRRRHSFTPRGYRRAHRSGTACRSCGSRPLVWHGSR